MLHHLAIIMDGNRRWAKSKMMPSIFGHKSGFDNLRTITGLAQNKGIKYLTVWALSTENLSQRGEEEIKGIIKLIDKSIELLPEFMEQGICVKTIGDIAKLPQKSQAVLTELSETTKDNTGMVLTVALVYGGQDEIVRATKKMLDAGIKSEEVSQETFREYLDTSELPTPDVIVRTGGDKRHSGFLLYDSAYSEYYFTDKKWPEFDEEELYKVIEFFEGSQRNFGK